MEKKKRKERLMRNEEQGIKGGRNHQSEIRVNGFCVESKRGNGGVTKQPDCPVLKGLLTRDLTTVRLNQG